MRTRRNNSETLPLDPEIERTIRRRIRRVATHTMADTHNDGYISGEEERLPTPPRRTLGDCMVPRGPRNRRSVVLPDNARTIGMVPAFYNMLVAKPFTGKDHEDPHDHLENFYDMVATMGVQEGQEDAAYMKFFHHTLLGEAKEWFKSQPPQSMTTWDEIETKFLTRFFPPTKFVSAKADITSFKQGSGEAFYEAWDRFQTLLRRCPNHGLDDVDQLNVFCNGLHHESRVLLDASAGGTMMRIQPE